MVFSVRQRLGEARATAALFAMSLRTHSARKAGRAGRKSRCRSGEVSGPVHGRVKPWVAAKEGANKRPPKTPLSHGFRGFAAIKAVAKSAMVFRTRAAAGLAAMACGCAACERHGASLVAAVSFQGWPKPVRNCNPQSGFTAKTGANKRPPKTPLSHGFRGFAAIKQVAKSDGFQRAAAAWRGAGNGCFVCNELADAFRMQGRAQTVPVR